MNISSKITINIQEFFNSDLLVSRQSARDLCEFILELNEKEIILDFKEISSFSRSFIDELSSKKSLFTSIGKEVEYINLSDAQTALLETVSRNKKVNRQFQTTSNTETVVI